VIDGKQVAGVFTVTDALEALVEVLEGDGTGGVAAPAGRSLIRGRR
jgi:hypothetical protein